MKKILIVENDPILRGIYRRKFDLSGFVVEAVDDGPMALETVSQFKPNLIQMDLTLPSMSGTELIRKIRALPNFKLVPIVVLSSFYRPDLIKEAFEAGANKCVSKMDCTPNLALEIVEQIFSGEILGLYPQPLGNSPVPVSMPPPPPKPAAPMAMPAPVEAPPAPSLLLRRPSPLSSPPATTSLPRLVIPPSPPKFGEAAPAPASPRRPGGPRRKKCRSPPRSSKCRRRRRGPPGRRFRSRSPRRCFPGARAGGAESAPPRRRRRRPRRRSLPRRRRKARRRRRPDFGSDATSAFRLEIRQEFLKRVPQMQADLRERVGALVRSKSTTEQLALLQGFNTSVSSLVGLAGITGFSRIAHLAGALEALIKDLQKKPKQMTSSVLRSIAHASDCLNVLFRDINQGAQEIPAVAADSGGGRRTDFAADDFGGAGQGQPALHLR